MNNLWALWAYCGLVDAKIRASDKDLPVITMSWQESRENFDPLSNFDLNWPKVRLQLGDFWWLSDFDAPCFFCCFDLTEKKQNVLWHNLCGSSDAKTDSFAMINEH